MYQGTFVLLTDAQNQTTFWILNVSCVIYNLLVLESAHFSVTQQKLSGIKHICIIQMVFVCPACLRLGFGFG